MMMVKKRHLVRRYGLPALILLFLLIWLSQQHAAEDTVLYNVVVHQETGRYDSARRLAEDRRILKQEKDPTDSSKAYHNADHSLDHHITLPNTTRSALSDDLSLHDKIHRDPDVSLQEKDTVAENRNLVDENTDEDLLSQDKEFQNISRNALNEDTNGAETTDNEKQSQNQEVLVIDMVLTNSSDVIQHHFGAEGFLDNSEPDKAVRPSPVDMHRPTAPSFRPTNAMKRISNDSRIKWQAEQQVVTVNNKLSNNFPVRSPVFPTTKPTTILSSTQKIDEDDDADDSLILARQMAAKNFVKSDAEHSPKDTWSADNFKSNLADVGLLSIKSDHQQSLSNGDANLSENLGRRQEMRELDWFAEVPQLPDYDLPLLNDKSSDLASSSTLQPKLLESRISVDALPDSNGTLSEGSTAKSEDDEVLADTDDVMSSAVVLGEVDPNKKYAVFSTTTENREALSFIFLLPLTALAWKRVGFDSIVVIVGPVDTWNSDELLHFVLSAVRQLDAVVVFLEPRPEKSVMISQVSRIFIANVLRARAAVANRKHPDVIDRTYIVTSDADIWPIYGDIYRLPEKYDILSLNSECCGAFSHRKVPYRMLPMANIGMRIGTWRKLTRRFGESPRSVDDILTAVVREFGPVALRPVRKGDNVGWFLDQMMVSLLVAGWTKRHGTGSVKFVPRDVGVDRVDRNSWDPGQGGVADKIDAHLLGSAYLPGVWAQVVPLITQLYGFETDRFVWCINYYDNFQKLFVSKYQSHQGGTWEHQ